jgi:hypothetical protein
MRWDAGKTYIRYDYRRLILRSGLAPNLRTKQTAENNEELQALHFRSP